MAYLNRPTGYANYYEEEKEVIRGPYDSYSSDYRVEGYGNGGYPVGHHLHNGGGYVDKVSEVVYESNPGYGRHHHNHLGGGAEYIERREEIVRENAYDPSRRYY